MGNQENLTPLYTEIMKAISLYFKLPAKLTAKKFIAKLSQQIDLQTVSQQSILKTFYDSFDWRLFNANLVCEHNHSQTISQLTLLNQKTGTLIAVEKTENVPYFTQQFPQGKFKQSIAAKLEMRALLPLCQLPVEVYRINVLNNDQKIVLRIQIDEYPSLNNRVQLIPLKGYEKAHHKVVNILGNKLNISPSSCTVLAEALEQQDRKTNDYNSKLSIKLKPDTRADKASKDIYKHLLVAMQMNQAGTIADTDTEFLHDFRVAVRRTRAGLNQIKNTLPAKTMAEYTPFFAWLGQITGPTRDLDVYLLNYQQYKKALPVSLQNDIAPLYSFLKQKQKHAQKELIKHLNSPKYTNQILAWEQYLNEPLAKKVKGSQANLQVKELANTRIWKVYQRVLKEGSLITEQSHAEALHDLRKTCKKLRYLMEFFQSLYAQNEIKDLIKTLKGFQAVLGDFQDYEIQEINIKKFSEEMMLKQVSSNTLLAMGVLVQHLDSMKCNARNHFTEQYSLFVKAENKSAFKRLFRNKA